MRILIANDDGFGTPGILALEAAALRITDDVFVMAPEAKRTAGSHGLTLARPLALTRHGPRHYTCSGTPTDGVVAAMTWLFRDGPPLDLVLAGINDGRNVGEDLAYSGTLGIAREAAFWGVPAVGLSRVKEADISDADGQWLTGLVGRLWATRTAWWRPGHYLSINLPQRLPAALHPARVGRDKIAAVAEVVAIEGEVTTIVVPRGRPKTSTPGDENSIIDAGHAAIVRFDAYGTAPLERDALAALAAP